MATRGGIALLGGPITSAGAPIDEEHYPTSGVRRERGIGSRRARIPRKTEVAHYRIGAGSREIGASPREIGTGSREVRIRPRGFEVNGPEIEGTHRLTRTAAYGRENQAGLTGIAISHRKRRSHLSENRS